MQQVATSAGVSTMTVSRVLNSPERVASETRRRVQQTMESMGYVPNALASGLLKGRTKTIALIVSDITNPFFASIVRGVEDLAQRNGYTVIIGNSDESVQKEAYYVKSLLSKRIDGLLITPAGNGSRTMLDVLKQRGNPFVLIDRDIDGVAADVVSSDSVGGAKMLTRYLIKLGHRRIGLINGHASISTARDRQQGYEEVLHEHNIEVRPELIIESHFTRDGTNAAVQPLLALPADRRPTAIFAANNFIAIDIITALREIGRSVPEDMAVVCFDDIEIASALDPFLTVIAQPARSLGTIATQFLFERLEHDPLAQPRRVRLSPDLIIRRSCGAYLGGFHHTSDRPH
ncbi:MAG: substrate-binding domain-containing protein [Herpetosiphon sp.]